MANESARVVEQTRRFGTAHADRALEQYPRHEHIGVQFTAPLRDELVGILEQGNRAVATMLAGNVAHSRSPAAALYVQLRRHPINPPGESFWGGFWRHQST